MASTITTPDRNHMGGHPQEIADNLISVAGAAKTDIEAIQAKQNATAGTALTDASVTIQSSQGAWRVLPAATLSTNRTITLGTTAAVAGDQITITRLDATANTLAVVNGGAGAGTLLTMPVSKVNFGLFQFNGTDWQLRQCGTQ